MNSFKIVYALLRVPRLFAALLLFPILGALVIVSIQLIFTASALNQISSVKNTELVAEPNLKWNFLRLVLFSDGQPIAKEPLLCIWEYDSITGKEEPPSSDCTPDRLDVALIVKDDLKPDYQKYLDLIRGNAYRLHVCKGCSPDLQLVYSDSSPSVKINSTYGLMLYQLLIGNEQKEIEIREIRKEINKTRENLGEVAVFLPNLKNPIQYSSLDISIVSVLNITSLAVIALWLGLKAHRRVLEYFTKSGALLPMVAATGKKSFYSALWIITALRVFAFLLASVPLLVVTLAASSTAASVIDYKSGYFYLWLLALLAGLSLATIIASISDLKDRHELFSIIYKLVPLILSGVGGAVWILTFLGTGDISGLLRGIVVAVPILGLAPVILSQVVQVPSYLLIIHILLSFFGARFLLRKNTNWFAAHLEEI